jgi:hypothetical protein
MSLRVVTPLPPDRTLSDAAVIIDAIAVLRSAGFTLTVPPVPSRPEPEPAPEYMRPAPPTPLNLRTILGDRTNECKIWELRENFRHALSRGELSFLRACEQAGPNLSVKDRCKLDTLWREARFARRECA